MRTGPVALEPLGPLDPNREPNRQTFWFGAELDPGNEQVWFRITLEAVRRMQEETPAPPLATAW